MIAEIKAAIDKLSSQERCALEACLHPFADDAWDEQMKRDAAAGRFGTFITETGDFASTGDTSNAHGFHLREVGMDWGQIVETGEALSVSGTPQVRCRWRIVTRRPCAGLPAGRSQKPAPVRSMPSNARAVPAFCPRQSRASDQATATSWRAWAISSLAICRI